MKLHGAEIKGTLTVPYKTALELSSGSVLDSCRLEDMFIQTDGSKIVMIDCYVSNCENKEPIEHGPVKNNTHDIKLIQCYIENVVFDAEIFANPGSQLIPREDCGGPTTQVNPKPAESKDTKEDK